MSERKLIVLLGVIGWGRNICRNPWKVGILYSFCGIRGEIRQELRKAVFFPFDRHVLLRKF
ncbi:hypothetical protein [Atrimonas thermophila]|uniref:hypothetical protein n=1 Tax=Atrimonas thermophila TaxID=3064161 RepID=UPI00399CCA1F